MLDCMIAVLTNWKHHKNNQIEKKKSKYDYERLKLTTEKTHTQTDEHQDKTLRAAIGQEKQTGKSRARRPTTVAYNC